MSLCQDMPLSYFPTVDVSEQHSLSELKRQQHPGHCTFTTFLSYEICFFSFATVMTVGAEKSVVEKEKILGYEIRNLTS